MPSEYKLERKGSGRAVTVKHNCWSGSAKNNPVMLTLHRTEQRKWEEGDFSVVLTPDEVEQLVIALSYFVKEAEVGD